MTIHPMQPSLAFLFQPVQPRIEYPGPVDCAVQLRPVRRDELLANLGGNTERAATMRSGFHGAVLGRRGAGHGSEPPETAEQQEQDNNDADQSNPAEAIPTVISSGVPVPASSTKQKQVSAGQ